MKEIYLNFGFEWTCWMFGIEWSNNKSCYRYFRLYFGPMSLELEFDWNIADRTM